LKLQIPVILTLVILLPITLLIIVPPMLEAQEKDNYVTYQINFESSYPEGIDGRFFVKKHNDWILYSPLQPQPFWLDVGKQEHRDGMLFKQIPNITHLAIQYWTTSNIEIVEVIGNGNFTTNMDIDGDKKTDYVFIKEVEWDDSPPKSGWEFRTNTISSKVVVKPVILPMETMKIDIETIIEITKKYPDLLTDEEVDILLSHTIGKGYGMIDQEVDSEAQKIMWKVLDHLAENGN